MGIQYVIHQTNPAPPPPTDQGSDPIQHSANIATDSNLVPQLIQQMQKMKTTNMEQIQSIINQMSLVGCPNHRRNNRPRTFNKYCWTHGACAHTSCECRNKSTGRQDASTVTNRMGGSTANFPNN